MSKQQEEMNKRFDEKYKGWYSARFEYRDGDGNKRFEVISINDGIPKEEALKMVARHVSNFEDGKITDFIENNYFKSFLQSEIDRAVAERESGLWRN